MLFSCKIEKISISALEIAPKNVERIKIFVCMFCARKRTILSKLAILVLVKFLPSPMDQLNVIP